MNLGTKLGPYQITDQLGKGGMGEVYRATDTRLDRTVAIKVLPEHLASDPQRRERFEREAKAVSSLNHPHICTLHDVGEQDGSYFLVMELVEGETLDSRLANGRLPLDKALEYAVQIADALDKAHRQGVVHRDLKPANIMLTKSGIKLLDFGLAKLKGDAAPSSGLSQAPTVDRFLTAEGTILGTLQYMAPEQLEGKDADARTDIFAFGAVVYEMVTGKKAFQGKSQASLIGAIMNSEPQPMQALQVMTPRALDHVVGRCLAKEPDNRWQTAADVMREVRWVREGGATEREIKRDGPLWKTATIVLAVVSAVLLSILLGLGPAAETATPSGAFGDFEVPSTRTLIELPEGARLAVGTQLPLIGVESPALSVSPDGKGLVYVAGSDEGTSLYYKDLTRTAGPVLLQGTEGAVYGFFSPDGTEIGFLTSDRLLKTSLDGRPQTLAQARTPVGASWIEGGLIYFFEDQGFTLTRHSVATGETTEIIINTNPRGHITQVLPNGRAALMTVTSPESFSLDYAEVHLLMLDNFGTSPLLLSGYGARYVSSGHLVFARAGSLLAVPFDGDALRVTGDAVTVATDVGMESIFGTVHADASTNGTLVYVAGGDFAVGRLAWVDRKGGSGFFAAPEDKYGVLDVDPDGRRVAVGVGDVNNYIYLWDEASGTGREFASRASRPRFNPTGDQLAYRTHLSDAWTILTQGINGNRAVELFSGGGESSYSDPTASSWSNGLISLDTFIGRQVSVLSVSDGGSPAPQADRAWGGALSPDGRHIAYSTDESGRFEVWAREVNEDFHRQISTEGGVEPVWCDSCDQDQIFFRNGNRVFSSEVNLDGQEPFGPPRLAFVGLEFVDTAGKSFDVSSNGETLYYVRRAAPPDRTKLGIVTNWFSELARLAPARN